MKLSGEAQAELIKVAAIALAVGVGVYAIRRGVQSINEAPGQVVGGLLSGAGGLLSDLAAQPVFAIGDALGVPRTSCKACNEAITEFNGASWYEQAALSFKVASYCAAQDYLTWSLTGKRPVCEGGGSGASGSW